MGFITDIIATPMGWLMWLIYSVVHNYGIALIIFGIITKAAQFPLGIKQHKTSIEMASFRPKLDALKKKYGNNKVKYNEEMQKMMSEEGYKPLGGCLPQLVPIILIFGLLDVVYKPLTYVLRISEDIINKGFEIARGIDLSILEAAGAKALETDAPGRFQQLDLIKLIQQAGVNPDVPGSILNNFDPDFVHKVQDFGLTFLGINLGDVPTLAFNVLIIVPIFAGAIAMASTLISMRISPTMQMSAEAGGGGGIAKGMMYFMPLLTLFFSFAFPVGLSLYWMMGNILAVGQALILNKMYNSKELIAQKQKEMEERKKSSKKKKVIVVESDDDEDAENGKGKKKSTKKITEKNPQNKKIAEARRLLAEQYGEEYED